MMNAFEQLSLIGLVPVIAIDDAADAVPLCRALRDGGLPVAEITFRTAAAEEAIRRVHAELPDVFLCAGTVLTTEQADRAAEAGAAVIVSPGLNPEVVYHCLKKGLPVCPGTATPSDVETAIELGLDTVKFFPAEAAGGLKMIKAMCGPYAQMKFMPTGGINENNMIDYLGYDRVLCCGGSWMVPKDAVKAKDWARITALTRSAVDKMLGLTLMRIGIPAADGGEAAAAAGMLARLMGCSSAANDRFEIMDPGECGVRGCIVMGANSAARAQWHLENRGFSFRGDSAVYKDGRLTAIDLADEIAGFTVRIVQE